MSTKGAKHKNKHEEGQRGTKRARAFLAKSEVEITAEILVYEKMQY